MIDNLSITVHTFASLISLTVDEILLPRYVNWSTNFSGLPLEVEMYFWEALDHLCSLQLS